VTRTQNHKHRNSPLHLSSDLEVATLLLDHGADVNLQNSVSVPSSLSPSSVKGSCLPSLSRCQEEPCPVGNSSLGSRSEGRSSGEGQEILFESLTADFCQLEQTALYVACRKNYQALVTLLLDRGTDVNLKNFVSDSASFADLP
jgi:ankyrin repeat protein